MSATVEFLQDIDAGTELTKVIKFLGGTSTVRAEVRTNLDAHRLIHKGLPSGAVTALQKQVKMLRDPEMLQKAIGISVRTAQRRKEPAKELSESQSSRLWDFAKIMSKAGQVLGSLEEAEHWMTSPAIGLEQQRPIDLMSTSAGVDLVEQLLGRMEYGVYA